MPALCDESEFRLTTADQVDEDALHAFLCDVYGESKAEFLRQHGNWWYRGAQNRLVITCGDRIAAYCGVIPTTSLIRGERVLAVWWVDLHVAPDFRGKGLQAILDREVRHLAGLKLGFPNELATGIHLKHGWGVREDLQSLILPLRPLRVKQVRTAKRVRGLVLRSVALVMTPWAKMVRDRMKQYEPVSAWKEVAPSEDLFSRVFERYKLLGISTTYRDADFVRWRFLDCPYRSELDFYFAGPSHCPTHFLITRTLDVDGHTVTRILDVFGDFENVLGLRDLLHLAVKGAVLRGACQVTALVSSKSLRSIYRSAGFIFGARSRFCWYGGSEDQIRGLREGVHWTLGDSDNDEPNT